VNAKRYAVAAVFAATVAALVTVFGTTYEWCETSSVDGRTQCGSATGLSVNGSWILLVVSVPIALTLFPVLVQSRAARTVSATLLWACCVVGLASIGMFFIPAAILMTIAAFGRDPVPTTAA
jgi:Kef-type K+ transport system membrane component KefB